MYWVVQHVMFPTHQAPFGTPTLPSSSEKLAFKARSSFSTPGRWLAPRIATVERWPNLVGGWHVPWLRGGIQSKITPPSWPGFQTKWVHMPHSGYITKLLTMAHEIKSLGTTTFHVQFFFGWKPTTLGSYCQGNKEHGILYNTCKITLYEYLICHIKKERAVCKRIFDKYEHICYQ